MVDNLSGSSATILSRTEMTTYPLPGKPVIVVAITFRYSDLPPLTVYIDKLKLTPEVERQAIRDAIKARQAQGPTEITL